MQSAPKVGTTHERSFEVEERFCITFDDSELPPILATPWLIWNLEYAALELTSPFLAAGEITVGISVEMEHLAATPMGEVVSCNARVIHVEGPVIAFQIEAHDCHEKIAMGLHKRRVVETRRIAERLNRKMQS